MPVCQISYTRDTARMHHLHCGVCSRDSVHRLWPKVISLYLRHRRINVHEQFSLFLLIFVSNQLLLDTSLLVATDFLSNGEMMLHQDTY